MAFPANFKWGTATASYQIEGAASQDGKGPSTWDMMCRKENAIFNNDTGDTTCDHYNRYEEDVEIMKQMSMQAYRFSICWSRVLPQGTGKVNEAGLDFYSRLVDKLLEDGIEPWVTLFHWDYPYHLYTRGGWLNPKSPEWFAEYTEIIVDKLSDRVSNWMTLNEPYCFLWLGHKTGNHAPGDKLGLEQVLLATHNALKSHGMAVKTIREKAKKQPNIGFAPVGKSFYPQTNSQEDIKAAYEMTYSFDSPDLWNSTWINDAVFKGCYPQDGLRVFGKSVPKFTDEDFKIISEPLDFFGFNFYRAPAVRMGDDGPEILSPKAGDPLTHFNWPLSPEGLEWAAKFHHERYKLPLVVTENGMANCDWVLSDGTVRDYQRIDYLKRYITALHRAIEAGADIRGYFVWTTMDNFEWAEGFSKRFGLVHVDYQTQKRTPKLSAWWYKKVAQTNGLHALEDGLD
ncbi:Beta-glucosidase A [Limihaloglobus sulfuriphilus]|uniref:Beta-glucosidase n=2 Tax=Limihaloglobus sulfuriphilus TaxID=1851148 RepID=A0A1Q2MDK5_9BACT|nr:Beta-glucosidase A [Limihaloglobus sulfuriphilus]